MSLYTEKTETFFQDSRGGKWKTKELAEAESIRLICNPPMAADQVAYFLKKLLTHADTRAWLLEQLGEQSPVNEQPEYALRVAEVWRAIHAWGVKLGYSSSKTPAEMLHTLLQDEPDAAIVRGIAEHIHMSVQTTPWEDAELVDKLLTAASTIPFSHLTMTSDDWLRVVGVAVQRAGYKLVKA